MAEAIRFYFDPACPWCYQTSRWARRLEELGELTIDWRVFSLAIVNRGDEGRAASDAGSAPALRTAVMVRRAHGEPAVGRFYAAQGAAIHERAEQGDDLAVIEESLRTAGLAPDLARRAMDDETTWTDVQREHDEVVSRHRAFGVPTIVLDGGEGLSMFGPIVIDVPSDADARELWRHFVWLARNDNFAEVKRERPRSPDLESVRRYQRRKAEEATEKQAAA
jgi:predicted DsbA family dithiol-disulfide isomerase